MSDFSKLDFYVIYEKPKDHPFHFVARKQSVLNDGKGTIQIGEIIGVSKNIDHLRQSMIDQGLICTSRHESDDPCILETWF